MLQSLRKYKAEVFQAMGHPTRVAILEYLSYGEMTVSRICENVEIEQANASQHLAILRNKQLVETRKEGNQIYYRLRNPLVADMLALMRQYFFEHLNESMQMLKQEKRELRRKAVRR
jgi:DNA-binding transcriptional ArsR family regulator